MKDFFLKCCLYILRVMMSFIYFFIKLFPMQKNKFLMLTRQSDEISIDFQMLRDELLKNNPNLNITVLCKKIPNRLIEKIIYCFYTIKCMYHLATSNVCIVEGYVIPVSILKHKKKLIIVQIWHALGAIKKFGKQVLDKEEGTKKNTATIMKMHKNYTFVTCASETTKEFYSEAFGIEKEKVLVLGMPRIDYLLGKDDKINIKIEQMIKEYPHLKEKENILYVPTFRKGKKNKANTIINSINTEKYNLIIKLHSLEETKIDSKYIVSNKYNTFELLKIADYVITDYSAVAFEASVLDKKVFFYLYDLKEYEKERGLNVKLKKEIPQATFEDIRPIVEKIEKKEYPYDELKAFKNRYIEITDTKNCERIIEHIKNLRED